jgi:hypothetical protein
VECFQEKEVTLLKYGFTVSKRQSKRYKDIVVLNLLKKLEIHRRNLKDYQENVRGELLPFPPYITLTKAIVCYVTHMVNQQEYRVVIENNFNSTTLYNEFVCDTTEGFPTGEEFKGKVLRALNKRKNVDELKRDDLCADAKKAVLDWFESEYPGIDMVTHWEPLPLPVSKKGELN